MTTVILQQPKTTTHLIRTLDLLKTDALNLLCVTLVLPTILSLPPHAVPHAHTPQTSQPWPNRLPPSMGCPVTAAVAQRARAYPSVTPSIVKH